MIQVRAGIKKQGCKSDSIGPGRRRSHDRKIKQTDRTRCNIAGVSYISKYSCSRILRKYA